MPVPRPSNEEKRLEALRRYRILDTAEEEAFDDFAQIAASVCDTPIALISLVDEQRQWFKARIGLSVTEGSREDAFCSYTILSDQVMVVEDARKDSRFAANPFVTGDPNIRFYAGAPLIDCEGHGLGSLCVIDRSPRTLEPRQEEALRAIARRAMAQIDLRLVVGQLAEALEQVRTLEGLLPMCSYCKSIRDDDGYWSSVENYISSHSSASLSHGVCPCCLKDHHPNTYARMVAAGKV